MPNSYMLKKNVFDILKHLKQHNDYDRYLEDLKFEEDCYYSPSYNYLIFI